MKKVSIIIPCYNVEKYIRQCLDSVIAQTYTNWEVICVDDGSSDFTSIIITEYVDRDSRIKLLEQKNQYAGVARNNGLSIAKGEYIVFIDGDDFLRKDMLELLVTKAEQTKADIVLCDAFFYDDLSGVISEPLYVLNRNLLNQVGEEFCSAEIPLNIFEVCWSVPWNKIFRKEFLLKTELKFQNIKRHNDEYFNTIALILANKITSVQDRLIYYRRNLPNSLQAYNTQGTTDYSMYYAMLAIKKKLEQIDSEGKYESAFRDKCIVTLVNILKKQKNYVNYEEIYNRINEEWIESLGIVDDYESRYSFQQSQLKKIKKMSAKEYLFEQYITQETMKSRFVFPFQEVGNSKNIIIYAAGKKGKAFFSQVMEQDYYNIVAWVDKYFEQYQSRGLPVKDIETIRNIRYDKIVLAIDDPQISKEVREMLIEMDVPQNKIITTERR